LPLSPTPLWLILVFRCLSISSFSMDSPRVSIVPSTLSVCIPIRVVVGLAARHGIYSRKQLGNRVSASSTVVFDDHPSSTHQTPLP
jgi:hypothetical protein